MHHQISMDMVFSFGVVLLALIFITINIVKMITNKKGSMCNGCSKDKCSTKVFSNYNVVPIEKI
jgi:hypothetical protein